MQNKGLYFNFLHGYPLGKPQKIVLLLMAGPLKGEGGGVKGLAIKEKKLFWELFFPTFQKFNGH